MAGNVAEMLAEEGVSRGGSWLKSDFYMQIETADTYDGPQIDLGFRVFMKVE